jgi:hypothetical protein
MKLADVDDVLLEALCLHELFRRMGFSANDIFIVLARAGNPESAILPRGLSVGDLALFVTLKAQGKEYNVIMGALPCPDAEFAKAWGEAVVLFNNATRAETDPIWDRSVIVKRAPVVALDVHAMGFVIPRFGN